MSDMAESVTVSCTEEEIQALEGIISDTRYYSRYITRARIILMLSRGMDVKAVARELGLDPRTVTTWRDRFLTDRINGIMKGSGYDRDERPDLRSVHVRSVIQQLSSAAPEGQAVSNPQEEKVETVSAPAVNATSKETCGPVDVSSCEYTIPEGMYLDHKTDIMILSVPDGHWPQNQDTKDFQTVEEAVMGSRQKADADHAVRSLLDDIYDPDGKANDTPKERESVTIQAFLQKMIEKQSATKGREYHAIIFTKDEDDSGSGIPGISALKIDRADNLNEFLSQVKHFFELFRAQGNTDAQGWKVRDRVQKLIRYELKEDAPFIWERSPLKRKARMTVSISYEDEDGNTFTVAEDMVEGKKISDINTSDLNGFIADISDWEKEGMDKTHEVLAHSIEKLANKANSESVKKNEEQTRTVTMESEPGRMTINMPVELVGTLWTKKSPSKRVLYTNGLRLLVYRESKSNSFESTGGNINQADHRPKGCELAASSIQDLIADDGTEVWKQVRKKSDKGLVRYNVTFGKEGNIMPGHTIPESAIHPVIPDNPKTRICSKDIQGLVKIYNKDRPQSQWITLQRARKCLEKDPMHTVYCIMDDICVKQQKAKRAVHGRKGQKGKHLFYTTDIYILYRDQEYSFTAPNTEEGCRMLLGFLLDEGLLENNELVFFSDGAQEISKNVEKVFGFRQYIYLMDWFHVQKKCYQYFTGMLKGGKGRLEENEEIRKEFFNLLWAGNYSGCIKYVLNLDASLIKRESERTALISYLKRKKAKLYEFAIRKGLGLLNSSNRVEQINNLFIALRQKKNGMSWGTVGSPALASITMLFVNKELENWIRNRQLGFKLVKTSGETCRVKWSHEVDEALRAA